jgi:hypothetical protein
MYINVFFHSKKTRSDQFGWCYRMFKSSTNPGKLLFSSQNSLSNPFTSKSTLLLNLIKLKYKSYKKIHVNHSLTFWLVISRWFWKTSLFWSLTRILRVRLKLGNQTFTCFNQIAINLLKIFSFLLWRLFTYIIRIPFL